MKERFGDRLELEVYTTDSPEALPYNFRSPTHVLFEGEFIPLTTALDKEKLATYLAQRV